MCAWAPLRVKGKQSHVLFQFMTQGELGHTCHSGCRWHRLVLNGGAAGQEDETKPASCGPGGGARWSECCPLGATGPVAAAAPWGQGQCQPPPVSSLNSKGRDAGHEPTMVVRRREGTMALPAGATWRRPQALPPETPVCCPAREPGPLLPADCISPVLSLALLDPGGCQEFPARGGHMWPTEVLAACLSPGHTVSVLGCRPQD